MRVLAIIIIIISSPSSITLANQIYNSRFYENNYKFVVIIKDKNLRIM
jgi:hypothetical protein